MRKVLLQNNPQKVVTHMKKHHPKDYENIIFLLIEVEKIGRKHPDFKNIGEGIKRIRYGRRRILCSNEGTNIYVWIIAIEKDTKKDYNRRKKYILSKI